MSSCRVLLEQLTCSATSLNCMMCDRQLNSPVRGLKLLINHHIKVVDVDVDVDFDVLVAVHVGKYYSSRAASAHGKKLN